MWRLKATAGAEEGRVIQVFYPQDSRFRKLDIEVEKGTVTMGAVEADELDVSVGAGTFDGLEKLWLVRRASAWAQALLPWKL